MWLNFSWGEPIDESLGIVCQGQFNMSSCGGPSEWSITRQKFEKAYFSCPETGEYPYAVMFSFYAGIDKDTPLYEYIKNIKGKRYQDDKWILVLTNEKLKGYNFKEECLEGILTGEIDQDKFGGDIFFFDLSSKNNGCV